ncbi:MAG: peptidoglycan DD-metalloendopeptidase family protein [Gemmatimonadota bacterium]
MKKLLLAAIPSLCATAILAVAALFALHDSWPWRNGRAVPTTTVQELFSERIDTLRRGETVSELFSRQGLPAPTLDRTSSNGLFDPRRLRPGLVFSFQRPSTDSLPTRVIFRSGPEQRVALQLTNEGWRAVAEPIVWRAEPVVLAGHITTSLYDALDTEIDDTLLAPEDRVRLAWDLADIFAWQVDFSRDIRPGDSFHVVAERLVSEDGEVRFGRVLAGEMVIGGQGYTAYRWTTADGSSGFYDADGRSLRRAFLLAPVQFRRISSGMSSGRMHPILGIIRKHEGIDFAAAAGTPVMAAGDGVVARREWTGGYGNLVEIRHANGIVTRYGHLQAFAKGLTPGMRLAQGDVIGYVGSTGMATGPHLHYEFRVNGVAREPRDADLGNGDPVPLAQRRDFDRERIHLLNLLNGESPTYADRRSEGRPAAGASF